MINQVKIVFDPSAAGGDWIEVDAVKLMGKSLPEGTTFNIDCQKLFHVKRYYNFTQNRCLIELFCGVVCVVSLPF